MYFKTSCLEQRYLEHFLNHTRFFLVGYDSPLSFSWHNWEVTCHSLLIVIKWRLLTINCFYYCCLSEPLYIVASLKQCNTTNNNIHLFPLFFHILSISSLGCMFLTHIERIFFGTTYLLA